VKIIALEDQFHNSHENKEEPVWVRGNLGEFEILT
jgi:hypothetical protein